MPRHLPNQSIVFTGRTTSCLNNDPRQYGILMQGQELWKYQMENTPCGDDPNGSICDVLMNEVCDDLINDSFTDASAWNAISSDAEIVESAGKAIFRYGIADIYREVEVNCIRPGMDTVIDGVFAKLSLDIYTSSGLAPGRLYVIAWNGNASSTTIIYDQTNPPVGLFEQYIVLDRTTYAFEIVFEATTPTDYIILDSIRVQRIVPCWKTIYDFDGMGGDPISPAWGYSLSAGSGNGKLTAIPSWDAYNPASFPTPTLTVAFNNTLTIGDQLTLQYTVSNMTAGSIQLKLGGNFGTTVTANGLYNEVIEDDTGSTYLEFWTSQDFDGSIEIVSGKLYSTCHTFDVVDAVTLDPVATGIEPDYLASGMIEVVFDPQNIPGEVGGEPNDFSLVTGCYRLRFNNCCTGEPEYSTTVINYTTDEHPCTMLLDAYSDDRAWGFDYSGRFTLTMRLRVNYFNPIWLNEGEESNDTAGRKRRPFVKIEKYYQCLFDYVDESTHDCINAMTLSDTFTIDGEQYFCRTKDYQPEWGERGRYNLAQSQIELQKINPVIFNRNCI